MRKNVYATFLSILLEKFFVGIVRPTLPYVLFAIGGLFLSFAVGLTFSRPLSWDLANIMILTLRGMITLIAIAAFGVTLYVIFIVFPDWLMSVWREAKKSGEDE